MYIHRLALHNFRCFPETLLELNYPGRAPEEGRPAPRLDNVNLLVGPNGSGKSALFQALALGAVGWWLAGSELQPEHLIRRERGVAGASGLTAEITLVTRLEASDFPPPASFTQLVERVLTTELTPTEAGEAISFVGPLPRLLRSENLGYFLVGYGDHRHAERPDLPEEGPGYPRYRRVASLFEEQAGLVPFATAHAGLQERGRLAEARALLNALLPDEVELTEEVDPLQRPLFDCNGVLLPFSALSAGFRAFAGWVWDLLYQLARLKPEDDPEQPFTELPGVVLVDPIDLFLHPEWQRTVVEQVATTFPRLQFLFASHSPLVAGALEPANLFVLEGNRVEQFQENVYGLTANQVLTSSYFGLRSTRAPGTGTLETLALRGTESFTLRGGLEQADAADLALDPQARALRMLEEIGEV